ncbi:MAG: ADP-ribosylglycohydrolase family protein [Arthrobacter sp.]|nr:ADP-ribosylglycohydrolase family protein [Arthrobacter sp.]
MTESIPSPTVSSRDALLGLLLGTAAASAAARGSDGSLPGAEASLQIAVLDGLADAVEWAQAGVGADDVACLWLGALRWVAATDGAVPDGAPEPPSRPVATALGALGDAAGGDPQNLTGLRSPEMSQPHRPFNRPAATVPELAATDGAGVLARALGLGLLSHATQEDVRRLATWAAAFSHGAPAAHAAAADAAALVRELRAGADPVPTLRLAQATPGEGEAREALRRGVGQVAAALEAGTSAFSGALAAAGEHDEAAAIVAGALAGALSGPSQVPPARLNEREAAAATLLADTLGLALGA